VFSCGYRIGFIPLFLICNVLPEGRVLTSVLLESDIAYILIMAAFSLTNGYLGSLCMINAPQVIRVFSNIPWVVSWGSIGMNACICEAASIHFH
jgi:hypothetical protein